MLEWESKEGGTVTLVYGPLVTAMTKKKIKILILQAIMYPVILRTRTIQRAD